MTDREALVHAASVLQTGRPLTPKTNKEVLDSINALIEEIDYNATFDPKPSR